MEFDNYAHPSQPSVLSQCMEIKTYHNFSEMLGNNDPNVHLTGPRLEGYDSSSSTNCAGGVGQRTKRMRTSFKHHQLRTMKSYFSINQNPDAKDLKQLAQKTGLSKRVLQVSMLLKVTLYLPKCNCELQKCYYF